MKKILVILFIVIAFPIAYWLASPLWRTEKVHETFQDIFVEMQKEMEVVTAFDAGDAAGAAPNEPMTADTLGTGAFHGLLGHSAEGDAVLLKVGGKYFVRFGDTFSVTNGPDLFVHFGKDGAYAKEARLAALKGNVGGQNYEVPADINPEEYDEVWIWCRAFSVPFAKAILK